jgi:hypothetical protein
LNLYWIYAAIVIIFTTVANMGPSGSSSWGGSSSGSSWSSSSSGWSHK